jgi:hypothetical protein
MKLKPALTALLVAFLASGAASAKGPLRVNPDNPRYFTDGTKGNDGKFTAVYLTGAHTWDNLVDMGRDDPPAPFDFDEYLAALERDGHNFIRLWAWDSTVWDTRANGELAMDFVHRVAPQPWLRTGPGNALDGKPKFDLTKLNDAYFQRLRQRVDAAGRRGVYVSVMLFEGWGLFHGNRGRAAPEGWAWRSHPFNPDNNVNGLAVDDARVHRLGNAKVNDLQAAYVRKVVDTVNEFDNVLYEVINEGGEKEWDWWVVRTIKDHEKSKPKQHPVGLTGHGAERVDSMLASPADWVSPGRADGYAEDPPAWDAKHSKVSIIDTDHVWGVGGTADWVWKALLRGHNPIFMDPYKGQVLEKRGAKWDDVRRALGEARGYAQRINLVAMAPEEKLASSGYCLATPGRHELLVYLPKGGDVSVDLSAARGPMAVEWYSPVRKGVESVGPVAAGSRRGLTAPFDGPAVLYLRAQPPKQQAAAEQWIQLFNGKDLTGWTPKIIGRDLGDNWRDTFRVEDGLLKVKYDQYPEFGGHFGHLFYKDKFSHYRLRVEYRFVGQQTKGGPGWAVRNSGAMLHCQDPKTMTRDQEFPVSIEVQFLGGDGTHERHTANLCTPGTNVEMNGRLITRHCTDSTSKTYHGDQWVTVEVEVRGNDVIRHLIDGQVVLEYNKPQLDDTDKDAKRLLQQGASKMVSEGYISLQAESHPVEFRKVELMRLNP